MPPSELVCAPRLSGVRPYAVPALGPPLDLDLRGNEGALPSADLLAGLDDPELLRRYPDARPLEAKLAERLGVAPEQVIVTAGGDEALDRVCRAVLSEGSEAVLPVPGFEMTSRYIRLSGGTTVEVSWPGAAFPLEEAMEAIGPATRLVVVTSPNNPTGAVIREAELRQLAEQAPAALVLVDLAYAEFADEDLTAAALELPNAVVVRSLSKAWGLAGLRIGYAVGPAELIGWLRAAGGPYPVSSLSLEVARRVLDQGSTADFSAYVRTEREALEAVLREGGARVVPSQANFVFARLERLDWFVAGMAGLGVGVRAFPGRAGLEDAVRIACPGDEARIGRLVEGVRKVLAPEALLLDVDGVVVDVRESYRAAIVGTAESFGVEVTAADIARVKAAGNANNDWRVTQRLLAEAGVEVELDEVTSRFEALYQGGLWRRERLIEPAEVLRELAARLPLAAVTGRPRRDAERLVAEQGLEGVFTTMVCMEDAPAKPSPEPVRLALERLAVGRAWMVGDTPDDIRAARAAGVVPWGCVAPGEDAGDALVAAGAGRVLPKLSALLEVL